MTRDGEVLERLGILLWGRDWQGPMTEALGLNERTIRRGRAGSELPDGVWQDLARLAREKARQLDRLASKIEMPRPGSVPIAPAGGHYWAQLDDRDPEIVSVEDGEVWAVGSQSPYPLSRWRLLEQISRYRPPASAQRQVGEPRPGSRPK